MALKKLSKLHGNLIFSNYNEFYFYKHCIKSIENKFHYKELEINETNLSNDDIDERISSISSRTILLKINSNQNQYVYDTFARKLIKNKIS